MRARAGPATGQSFPAVVAEGCVSVECFRNGARPHLHHAHPMATAEPARRHDGGWHLCIFSFCCIALRAGNEGCGHPATRIHQPMLCTPERTAQQPAEMLCVEGAAFSTSVMGLCSRLCRQTGPVAASVTIWGWQSCVVVPPPAAGGFGQCPGGSRAGPGRRPLCEEHENLW